MFNPLIWYGQRLLAGGMMLAVLAANVPVSTASDLSDGSFSDGSLSISDLSILEGRTEARRIVRRRPNRSLRRRPPAPPRRLPPNLVQPGGGLDAAAQSCDPNSAPLTALVPVQNPVFTASAHPTFLFYLPDAPEQIDYAEFILLSADEKEEIYTTQFVPVKTGVVSISLPPTSAPALEANQVYHWYLNVHCEAATAQDASSPAVNGWVQRLPESEPVVDEIAAIAPDDTAITDDVEVPEVWYDAIAQVAENLSADNIAEPAATAEQTELSRALWENWLSAVGLSEVADAPVVGEVVTE